jgi:hypothetical protein
VASRDIGTPQIQPTKYIGDRPPQRNLRQLRPPHPLAKPRSRPHPPRRAQPPRAALSPSPLPTSSKPSKSPQKKSAPSKANSQICRKSIPSSPSHHETHTLAPTR